jgi:hypothetical protein
VSYRDNADALYERAAALERELERAQAELARRDAEANERREPVREWRESPRPLRELPAAETSLAQLIDTLMPAIPPPPPQPKPPLPPPSDHQMTQVTAERLAYLDSECLLLVGAIVEQLVAAPSEGLRDRLRAIVRGLVRR